MLLYQCFWRLPINMFLQIAQFFSQLYTNYVRINSAMISNKNRHELYSNCLIDI